MVINCLRITKYNSHRSDATVTRDEEYLAQERRFNDLFKVVERLQQDALAFRDGVVGNERGICLAFLRWQDDTKNKGAVLTALLGHQAAMVSFITVIYDTQLGMQPVEGEVQRRFQQTPAEAVQAACDAEAAMGYCRDEVLPELVGRPRQRETGIFRGFNRMRWIAMWYDPPWNCAT